MHHVLVTLRAHGDLTKIEFEDALLRRLIPACLDVESSLFGIDADLRTEDQTGLGSTSADGPTGMLTFSSFDDGKLDAESIGEMIADVAIVTSGYRSEATVVGDRDATWVGHATPGTKLIVFLRRGGADQARFDEWIASTVPELSRALDDAVMVVHRLTSQLSPSPDFDLAVTIAFPTQSAVDSALERGLAELEAGVFDTDASVRFLAFEHRFHADPNHWGTDQATGSNST